MYPGPRVYVCVCVLHSECVSSAQPCAYKEGISEHKERGAESKRDYANSKYQKKRKTHVSIFSPPSSLYIYIFSCQCFTDTQ